MPVAWTAAGVAWRRIAGPGGSASSQPIGLFQDTPISLARFRRLSHTAESQQHHDKGPTLPPPTRRRSRRRRSHNEKRRLMRDPADDLIERLLDTVHYEGSSKHKRHRHLFGRAL